MTFSDIQTEIADRLGITASADLTRIGRAINRKHREITSALGVKRTARRTTATSAASVGFSTLSFANCEKVVTLVNRNVTPYFELQEVTLDELRDEMPFQSSDLPTRWAPQSATADTVVILMNVLAATTFSLHGDIYGTAATLSGTNTPLFSESYHDILVDAVLEDEYLKVEKTALSNISKGRVEKRMGELRHWFAVSTTKDIHQGKTRPKGFQRNNVMQ